MNRTRVLIAGAAGRDFHNFNLVYRGREEFEVVAFTATQIPNIEGRLYPPQLAGDLYPDGIPIVPEADLERAIRRYAVDEVVFGQPGDLVLLGARTLEGFGADVDSRRKRLVASGRHLAAPSD